MSFDVESRPSHGDGPTSGDPKPKRRHRRGLWDHPDFLRLWSAQAISAIGSRITRTALPIIAISTLNQPETSVALLWSLYIIPGIVLALFAGGFVDRTRKRRVLIAADLFRAACVASLSFAWLLHMLTMAQLIIVGMLVGAASALFQIADVAYLPTLVGKKELPEGNAKLEATEGVAEISGPASAGILIGLLGAPLAVALDAASYLWSAFMLGRIRTPEPAPPPSASSALSAESSTTSRTLRDLKTGMRAIFGHPHVRPIVVALLVWSIVGGFFTSLYALFCLRTLELTPELFGAIVAIGGLGSLAGAFISRRLVARIGLGPTMIVSAVISVVSGVLIPLARGPEWLALLCLGSHQLINDCFSVVFMINATSLRQTVLPRTVLGRANAAVHICMSGPYPIVILAAGALAEATSIRTAVWVGMLIGLVVPFMLLSLRSLKQMPEAAASSAELAIEPTSSSSDLSLPLNT
jgi:MFS family permease